MRRSFSSLAEWTETPTGIVAQIMGHKPNATAERHYKVRPLDLLRKWHDKIEAWLLDQAGRVVLVDSAHRVLHVPVEGLQGPITWLAMSRDGARVALVSRGDLFVGRVADIAKFRNHFA